MEEVLPKKWVKTKLGEITSKPQYGWTSKSDNFGEYRYIRTTDIGKNTVNWLKVPYCVDLPDSIEKYLLKENDILISRAGSIGLSFLVEDLIEDTLFASYLIRFKPLINGKFVSYFLKSNQYWRAISESAVGIAVKNINAPKLQSISFPLPPLPEQERIVARLDVLFTQIEGIKLGIEKINQLNEKFFESIFYNNLGLTNLSKYLTERKARVGNSWAKYPKIGVSRKDGIIDLATGTKETFENYKIVKPGDIIYNTMRVNIGSIAIYEGGVDAITSPDYVVFSVENLSKYLLLNYLKGKEGATNISSVTKGSVRSRLYFKNLITIPFPILSERQHEVSEAILYWFYINTKKLNKSFDEVFNKLSSSILDKAFKGELVEQLPTDGDAKDLLTEIKKLKVK